jgi:hypothetical protein
VSRESRARALTRPASLLTADAALLGRLPPPAIGVTQDQWDSLLSEAALREALARLDQALTDVRAKATAEGATIGRDLRPAAVSFAELARKVARMLWQLAAFAPTGPRRLVRPLASFIAGMAVALDQAGSWFRTGLVGPGPELPTVGDSSNWHMPGVPDPIAASFRVDKAELVDHRGELSDARLLAAYRNRLPELTDICAELVYSITQPPLDLFATLEPLLELLRIERPLLAWTVATQTLALMREAAAADPTRVKAVFTQLRQRAAPRAASRERLATVTRTTEGAATEAERALGELSAYRILVEGQLRPWAWALLRLAGADGEMPMVAKLRGRLAASPHPLHAYLAGALVPALRNADAHEEAHFDQLRGQLAIGSDHIDLSVVRASNAELRAIDTGLEMALACACAQVEPIAEAYSVRPGDPLTATEALSQAEQRYGHAGLEVWSLRRDRGTVQVRLDEIDPLRLANPCFLATLQANGLVAGVTRWQIGLRERDGWVIDLPATVLRENWPVFERAARWFEEIPQETFLPCVTWARLAVELPGVAMRAAAWLALNDLQHAIEEAETRAVLDIPWFERRVLNVIGACSATLRVMPPAEAQPLQVALDLARHIRLALAGMQLSRPLEVLIREVLRERDRLPVPAILPTVDPRPVTVAEQDE